MNFDPNALFYAMQIYFQKKFLDIPKFKRERLYFLNEGSSRSSKTFDAFHFLYWLCGLPEYQKDGLSIYVYRSTLKDCREITYQEDFVQCMKLMGVYDESYARNAGVSPEYRLFSSVIKFRGLDGSSEAGRKDVVFFNEALDNDDEGLVLDLTLRCTTCAIFDWNPKLTDHFLFKWEGRKNHLFTRTTFLDNKHLDNVVKNDILSTCPWDFCDFDFERREWRCAESDRKPNIDNAKYNTINRWRWLVYGEGIRCPQDGAVFPDITWIDDFPEDCDEVNYGLDFGYRVDPCAFVRVGRKGLNLYIESLFYQPCENPDELYEYLLPFLLKEVETRKKMAKGLDYPSIHVVCDSASTFIATGVDFIDVLDNTRYLRGHEFQFDPVFKKFPIVTGISAMNRFKLNIVRDKNAKKEFENYTRIKQNGHFIEKFSERDNHIIDAVRYVVMEWYASYVQV